MTGVWSGTLFYLLTIYFVHGKIDTNEDTAESGEHEIYESGEQIGAAVTQINRHPYAASLLKNDTYVCSAVVLNTYWLLTLSKCFDSDVISSYVSHKNVGNYTIRVGSSYHGKGGSLYKIKSLINNFDVKVSGVKLEAALIFGSRIRSVHLPRSDDEAALGYLASIIAWTPTGHMRVVNVPIIESSICEPHTKMLPGNYICVGGVEDPDRHFCRKDNGGAIIQNNTLVAIASYIHTCALYTKTHAFPKVASFARWLDSVIWDEDNRPTTTAPTSTTLNSKPAQNTTETAQSQNPFFADPSKFMLTLPFDPVNVPLEPAEDNSVIPRMSLYESYLQNLARAKTSTTQDPNVIEERKREWMQKFGKMMMLPQIYTKKHEQFDYN